MKKLTLFVFVLSMTTIVFGQNFTEKKIVTTSGIGLGSVIAVVASWGRKKIKKHRYE